MTFGEKLQGLRARAGLSQDALAELLDVSRQAVSKWERNEAMPEAEKVAFCKTLDTIYRRSKQESRAGFPHITALTEQGEGERHE